MSPSFRRVGRALLAAAFVAAIAAPSAQAITLDYQCKFPKLGVQPVRLTVGAELPTSAIPTGRTVGPVRYSGTFTYTGAFPSGYNSVDGLAVLWDAGRAKPGTGSGVRVRYTRPDGSVSDDRAEFSQVVFEYPMSTKVPWLASVSGNAQAISFSAPGQVKLALTALDLNFRPTRADYTTPVAGLDTPTTDVDGLPYADSDGDPNTFNVPCKRVSTGSLQLGVIDVVQAGEATIPPPVLPAPGAYNQWSFQRTSIQLLWGASPGGSRVMEYVVRYSPGGPPEGIRVPRDHLWWSFRDLLPATTYRFAVSAVETNGGETAPVIQELSTLGPPLGPPTTPAGLRLVNSTPTGMEFEWNASTDDGTVETYEVVREDGVVAASSPNPTATVYNTADPGSEHTYRVVAIDDEGRRSEASDSLTVRGFPAVPAGARRIPLSCSFPWHDSLYDSYYAYLDAVVGGANTVATGEPTGQISVTGQLRFTPNDMRRLAGITGLRSIVQAGGAGNALQAQITPPGGTPSGEQGPLTAAPWTPVADSRTALGTWQIGATLPSQAFSTPGNALLALQQLDFNLRGLDEAGRPVTDRLTTKVFDNPPHSDIDGDPNTFNVHCVPGWHVNRQLGTIKVEDAPQPTTPVAGGSYAFTAAGSTTIKTLAKGTLSLSGAATAKVTAGTGAVNGALSLNPASGRLNAAGFLPVTAKIGFSPSGSAAGSLVGGVFKLSQKVRIKVMEVKLFGAIPIAAGNNCQSRSLTDLALRSEPGFDPKAGGQLAGTYNVSDLNGCSGLDGQVSSLTASDGNPITLNLTPQA